MQQSERREPRIFANQRKRTRQNGLRRSDHAHHAKARPSLIEELSTLTAEIDAAQGIQATAEDQNSISAISVLDPDLHARLSQYEGDLIDARRRIEHQRQVIERLGNEAELREEYLHELETTIVTLRAKLVELRRL